MSDNQIIEVQPIVIEDVKPEAAKPNLKPILLASVAALMMGVLGAIGTHYLMPKPDFMPQINGLHNELTAKIADNQKIITDNNKNTAAQIVNLSKKIDDLDQQIKNLPQVKEIKTVENSDFLKAQIEELKTDLAKISPKMNLIEKEQGANKSSQSLNLGYIILNKLDRGENITADLKNLGNLNSSFNNMPILSDKPLISPAMLIKNLKEIKFFEAKQESNNSPSWFEKITHSAGSLVKITAKDGEKSTPNALKEIETAILSKDYTKSLTLWAAIRATIADDKGFEANLTYAQKQMQVLADFKANLNKMSAN